MKKESGHIPGWVIFAAILLGYWLIATDRVQINLPQLWPTAATAVYEPPAVIIAAPATATPARPLPIETVVPLDNRAIQPVQQTPVPAHVPPTPATASSLADLYIIHGPDVVTPCLLAIQNYRELTAACDGIRADLIRIAAEQEAQP